MKTKPKAIVTGGLLSTYDSPVPEDYLFIGALIEGIYGGTDRHAAELILPLLEEIETLRVALDTAENVLRNTLARMKMEWRTS